MVKIGQLTVNSNLWWWEYDTLILGGWGIFYGKWIIVCLKILYFSSLSACLTYVTMFLAACYRTYPNFNVAVFLNPLLHGYLYVYF